MGHDAEGASTQSARLWKAYAAIAFVLSLVCDGWSSKPSPFVHQLLLLPCTLALGLLLWHLLSIPSAELTLRAPSSSPEMPTWWPWVLLLWEGSALALVAIESLHFEQFGYHLGLVRCGCGVVVIATGWLIYFVGKRASQLIAAVSLTYAAGAVVSLASFPLNYLRSDMLPVIGWADERLVHHLNPYSAMHVGARLYDFPYLPGMLVGFLPAVAASLDLRWANLVYVLLGAWLVYRAAQPSSRRAVASLLGVFLLCPFLQYRHDLYLEPHWFSVALAIVLMHRKRFAWSALVWGVSAAIYQLSWVILPFVFLYGLRRRGVVEVCKLCAACLAGFLLISGPFLHVAFHQVANNTVGQWSRLPHALADPINVSYWLTYFVRPDQLRWVQALVLTVVFAYCVAKRRCESLTDTLRWMSIALALFIPLNVLVDGYFYLTLLWLLLLYVCSASGWWAGGDGPLRGGLTNTREQTAA